MTVRLDRVQQALTEAFAGLADSVAWAYGSPPSDLGTALRMRMTAGPQDHLQEHALGEVAIGLASVSLRITAATVGSRIRVVVNGLGYHHDVTTGETIEVVRDALLAQLQLGEDGLVIAATVGTDAIALEAVDLGGLVVAELTGAIAAESAVSASPSLVRESTELTLVTVELFSKGTSPRFGAIALASAARARLQRTSAVESLSRYGLAIWSRGKVNDLAAIAGGGWESRSTFDLVIAVASTVASPVDTIEQVNVTITAALPLSTITETASVTAP